MRLGILSDPHGNSLGLIAALRALEGSRVDRLLCAGDIVGYYPFVNETIDTLIAAGVECIAGNHDLYLRGDRPTTRERWKAYQLDYVDEVITHENRQWLAALPLQLDIEVGRTRITMCHGSPWSPEEYIYPDATDLERFGAVNVDVIIMGHTHIPMVRRLEVGQREVLLFNPGSCGQPRDYVPLASYGLLDTDTQEARIERVPYDIAAVQNRCEELGFDASVRAILLRTR